MFPFPLASPKFKYTLGVKVLPADRRTVIASESYRHEIDVKRKLLSIAPESYYQRLSTSPADEAEVVKMLLAETPWLEGGRNRILHEALEIDEDAPLFSISRHVQEDLLLIDINQELQPLVAGVVCFPSGWTVCDKIGKPMSEIHQPVPSFDATLTPPVGRLLGSLKVGRPVWRVNWGIRPSDQLDQSPIFADAIHEMAAAVTASNAGERCFFRMEYQTLTRISKTNAVLFTIHTHQFPISKIKGIDRTNLIGNLETCPKEILEYKGILPMNDALLEYLKGTVKQ